MALAQFIAPLEILPYDIKSASPLYKTSSISDTVRSPPTTETGISPISGLILVSGFQIISFF